MAKVSRDGGQGDAARKAERRARMPQVMKPNRRKPFLRNELMERSSNLVGVPTAGVAPIEDECFVAKPSSQITQVPLLLGDPVPSRAVRTNAGKTPDRGLRSVFSLPITTLPSRFFAARTITYVPDFRSTSPQRKPHISPRRAPTPTANTMINSSSVPRAAPSRLLTSLETKVRRMRTDVALSGLPFVALLRDVSLASRKTRRTSSGLRLSSFFGPITGKTWQRSRRSYKLTVVGSFSMRFASRNRSASCLNVRGPNSANSSAASLPTAGHTSSP